MLKFQSRSLGAVPNLEVWREHWQCVLRNPQAGFVNLHAQRESQLAIQTRAAQIGPVSRVLVVGIGGSSLGAQVIHKSLAAKTPVEFLESPDPQTWAGIIHNCEPQVRDQHIVLVSKTGATLETLAWIEQMNSSFPDWLGRRQCTVIASKSSGPLQNWAERAQIPCLWIPENVGGRYSVLTSAGLFPAALMGLDISQFIKGAEWALSQVEMTAEVSAEISTSMARAEWITQLWTFSDALSGFGNWWQQLWGESLAKRINRLNQAAPRVSTPMPCQGPRDQHSMLQQLIEGARDKYIFIQRVRGLDSGGPFFNTSLFSDAPFYNRQISLGRVIEAEALAFERTLNETQIPCSVLTLDQLNEKSLGALFMFWQMVIAQIGESLNIDAYNQPGVELGKRYAMEILLQSTR